MHCSKCKGAKTHKRAKCPKCDGTTPEVGSSIGNSSKPSRESKRKSETPKYFSSGSGASSSQKLARRTKAEARVVRELLDHTPVEQHAVSSTDEWFQTLERSHLLLERGLITEEDYETVKKSWLKSITDKK